MRILTAHGVGASISAITEVHEESMKALDNREVAEEGAVFWLKWNTRVLERMGVKKDVDVLAKRISEVWWDYARPEVYPDVVDTLAKLKARDIKLGIVTNGFREDIDQILRRLRLENYFDVSVGADACKKAKPDAEIFMYALDKLGVHAEETLFVGDDVKRDYEGAKRAGLHALLVDRDGNVPQNREAIKSLVEVLEYV
jgi:putative hydrolase of the HAD superfamily